MTPRTSLSTKTRPKVQLAGRTELNFVDSYKYNIAAYRLAEMLGVEDMLPVYVECKYQGDPGCLSWWLPVKMEEERVKQKIDAPDSDAWNNQMYRIRVFDEFSRRYPKSFDKAESAKGAMLRRRCPYRGKFVWPKRSPHAWGGAIADLSQLGTSGSVKCFGIS
jgi:hypothetical protein